jgi:type IV secretory pathway VirB2 component (pilin)
VTDTDTEIRMAVIDEKIRQMETAQTNLAASIAELARSVRALEHALAAQKPWAALFQHLITAVLTGVATYLVAKGQHQQ